MIQPVIESATFRLLAQCLNQLRHRVPPVHWGYFLKVKRSGVSLTNHYHLAPWFQLRRATPLTFSVASWLVEGRNVPYTK